MDISCIYIKKQDKWKRQDAVVESPQPLENERSLCCLKRLSEMLTRTTTTTTTMEHEFKKTNKLPAARNC